MKDLQEFSRCPISADFHGDHEQQDKPMSGGVHKRAHQCCSLSGVVQGAILVRTAQHEVMFPWASQDMLQSRSSSMRHRYDVVRKLGDYSLSKRG